MSESANVEVDTIREEIYARDKGHENRAIILHKGLWYLYFENSVEQLFEFNEDYKNFISHSRYSCGLQFLDYIPSEKICKKTFTYSQYLYSRTEDCFYYYNHETNNLVTIPENCFDKNPDYDAHELAKQILKMGTHVKRNELNIILELEPRQLALITDITGHTQKKCFTLTKQQEESINNRINNEKVRSTINKSTLGAALSGFGIGALIGGLVLAPVYSWALFPAIFIAAGVLSLGLSLLVFAIGRLYLCCMEKPISEIVHNSSDDDSYTSTAFLKSELNVYNKKENLNTPDVVYTIETVQQDTQYLNYSNPPHQYYTYSYPQQNNDTESSEESEYSVSPRFTKYG